MLKLPKKTDDIVKTDDIIKTGETVKTCETTEEIFCRGGGVQLLIFKLMFFVRGGGRLPGPKNFNTQSQLYDEL